MMIAGPEQLYIPDYQYISRTAYELFNPLSPEEAFLSVERSGAAFTFGFRYVAFPILIGLDVASLTHNCLLVFGATAVSCS